MKRHTDCFLALVFVVSILRPAIAELPPLGPRVVLRFESYPAYELRKTTPGTIDERLLPLWMSTLDSPDRDLHRQVGDALGHAKAVGMKGLDETVTVRLRKTFEETDHPVVRRSMANALIALDDREASEMFWEKGQSDYQLALIVGPALGRWKYGPAVEEALSRLEDPLALAALKRLSIDLLGNAKEEKAKGPLLKLVLSLEAKGDLRLAAASALAGTFSQGLETPARELCDRNRAADPLPGLLSARLLERHSDAVTVALLQELARDPNTAVQALALKRLGQIDQQKVAKFALDPESAPAFSVQHPDANVRLALIEALYSIGQAEAIPVLKAFLDDPHPENRTYAGDALYDLARRNDNFRALVEEQLLAAVAESSWRTLERASIIAGGLDSEPCTPHLVRLLSHERKEVAVASAWALKELAVAETLPAVLKKLEENLNAKYAFDTKAGLANYDKAQEQCQHLNEQLGHMKYAPAEATLRRWIPQLTPGRSINHSTARATGMWALGMIYEDKPNPELTALLVPRLHAMTAMFNPEPQIIGEAVAYTVGLMGDQSGLNDIQKYAARSGVERNVFDAAAWAVGRITGTPLPLPGPVVLRTPDWFLEPIEE